MAIPTAQASSLAMDARGLDALRTRARDDPKAAAGSAAREFEALLVQQMMKAMRDALPQEGPLSSDAGKSWIAMFDREVAQKMAARGIGLAQAIERQLARQITTPAPAGDADAKASVPSSSVARPPVATDPATSRAAPPVAPRAGASAVPGAGVPAGGTGAGVAQTVRDFADRVRPHAEAAAKKLGVSADWLIAQAGLETGWGRSQPKSADGAASNNLFGMKTGSRWTGASVAAATVEVVAGVAQPVVAAFRAYGTVADAFQDYARVMQSSRRYAGALGAGDARGWAAGLAKAGYATDPRYAEKLTQAIAMVGRHAPAPAQLSASAPDISRESPRRA